MNHLATLAMTLAAMTPPERERAEFVVLVNCIGTVESGLNYKAEGDGKAAKGAWQMHIAAWITANQWRKANGMPTIPRDAWRNADNQRAMALCYVSWCKEKLQENGIKEPTVEQIYVAFGWGFGNFKDVGFDMAKVPEKKRDAAERVGNIYRELIK